MTLEDNSIVRYFSDLPEHRIERTRLHKLIDIVFISLCSTLCGYDEWEEMELFAKTKEAWFRRFIELPNGIPSHDTLRRFWLQLDPEAFRCSFQNWIASLGIDTQDKIIAIDGKTLRGSGKRTQGNTPVHMVSAWLHENNLVIGQLATQEKSNEITAIPNLLEMLIIKGSVVTIDAMGCQTKIAQQVINQQGDYVLGLKGNQGHLYEETREFFETFEDNTWLDKHGSNHQTIDGDHGRVETRCYTAIASHYIESAAHWPGIKSVVMVKTECHHSGNTRHDRRYYISSCTPDAKRLGHAIRSHWSIENKLHWSLDTCFFEDACRSRMGHVAENLAMLRHIALNILKNSKFKASLRKKRKRAAIDDAFLESLLFS